MVVELERLIGEARKQGASDLHLSAGLPPWLRTDGKLVQAAGEAWSVARLNHVLAGLAPPALQEALTAGADVDFALEHAGLGRLRVHAYVQREGPAAAVRLLPAALPSLAALGVPSSLNAVLAQPHGLVLVCGATGAGKSTTLAAILDHLNGERAGHILTIEDPVEFVHVSKRCLVHQRELDRDTPDFATALRSALREDPDYLLIGELRDLETIRLALRAAECGHLVLATMHAGSAARAVARISGAFPAGEQGLACSVLAESLRAVLAQRLLQRAGGGRVAAYELMLATPAVRHLIREKKSGQLDAAIQLGTAQGMQTMQQQLGWLLREGQISAAEAAFHSSP